MPLLRYLINYNESKVFSLAVCTCVLEEVNERLMSYILYIAVQHTSPVVST